MAKLLSSLNLNDRVRFGKHQVNAEVPWPIIWHITAKNHVCVPAYPENSVTLHTDYLVDFRAFDALEPANPDANRRTKGNNRFLHSNILQWLNSHAAAGEWYVPQHEFDSPPDTRASVKDYDTFYVQRPGFLHYFTDRERDVILETTLRTVKNKVVDGGGYEDITAKVFFPSKTELGLPDENGIAEGAKWPAYSDEASLKASTARQCFENTLNDNLTDTYIEPIDYWTRTPGSANSCSLANVNVDGWPTQYTAHLGALGVRPALNLSGDTLVTDTVDADGCYTVIFNDQPEINAVTPLNIGDTCSPPAVTCKFSDPNNDTLTVTETLNGEIIRTLTNQTSGTEITSDLSTYWNKIPPDKLNSLVIDVFDGLVNTTRTWTFTKRLVDTLINSGKSDGAAGLTYTSGSKPPIKMFFTENSKNETPVWTEAPYNLSAYCATDSGDAKYTLEVKDGKIKDETMDETTDMLKEQ